jgi:hypothetical protein
MGGWNQVVGIAAVPWAGERDWGKKSWVEFNVSALTQGFLIGLNTLFILGVSQFYFLILRVYF